MPLFHRKSYRRRGSASRHAQMMYLIEPERYYKPKVRRQRSVRGRNARRRVSRRR